MQTVKQTEFWNELCPRDSQTKRIYDKIPSVQLLGTRETSLTMFDTKKLILTKEETVEFNSFNYNI